MKSLKSGPLSAPPVPNAAIRTSWPEPGETTITTGLDFQGPELNPTPVPPLASLELDPWAFLEFQEPIEHPQMLAFQVAQLTVGMAELLARLSAVESWARGEIENGLIVIPQTGGDDYEVSSAAYGDGGPTEGRR